MESCAAEGLINLPNESDVYQSFFNFRMEYTNYHPFISLSICLLGIVANSINVIVLTRRNMITPVNALLVCIAVLDMTVMTSYSIFTIHFGLVSFRYCQLTYFPHFWGLFAMFHAHMSLVGHTMSLWISILVAFVRYLSLNLHRAQRGIQFSIGKCLALVVVIFVIVNVANTASYISYQLIDVPVEYVYPEYCENLINSTELISVPKVNDNCRLLKSAFWITGIGFKVLPCVLLALMIGLLVRQLSAVRKRHLKLTENRREKRKTEPSERTTRMLITLVSVFFATELPQGLVAVASGIFSNHFHRHIYTAIGDILDLLSLINATVSFFIYCSMSQQFRNTFRSVICRFPMRKPAEAKPLIRRVQPTTAGVTDV